MKIDNRIALDHR